MHPVLKPARALCSGNVKSSDAYAKVLVYLSAVCSREARELRAPRATASCSASGRGRRWRTTSRASPCRGRRWQRRRRRGGRRGGAAASGSTSGTASSSSMSTCRTSVAPGMRSRSATVLAGSTPTRRNSASSLPL
uniref:Uncharacterized protein n=1 Tax=Aegilops tauschii subsp. strangulata TaxID=200361 RepID=A0A452ZMG4_AEGTS